MRTPEKENPGWRTGAGEVNQDSVNNTTIPPESQAKFEKIPPELKTRPQWVVWRQEEREGKPTKVPYRPQNPKKKADTTAPDTWGTFEQALSVAQTNGFHGIGYVFSPQDDYAGVDLDKCRDRETGKIEPWARANIDRLQSYTEKSPSGTGLHILIKGTVPTGGNKKGKVEMYSQGRYFTMTGHHLEGTPTTIEARQAELTTLHTEIFGKPQPPSKAPSQAPALELSDRELIEKAQQAANGEKFGRLWRGDTTGHPSPSEADLALCLMLAFWTGPDPARIDRLFRDSGLFRAKKWDRPTAGITYGRKTIEKALSDTTEFYQAPKSQARPQGEAATGGQAIDRDYDKAEREAIQTERSRIVSAANLLSRKYSKQDFVIDGGILPAGGGLIIAGESGDGKSLLRTEFSVHLVMGWPIWGLEVPTSRRVFILQFENTEATEAYRLRKMLRGLEIQNFPDLLSFSDPKTRVDLGRQNDRDYILKLIEESKADVVIFDPLTSIHSVNENDNVQIRKILDNITEINRKTGTTAIVIHHFGKPTEYSITAHRTRGASSIRDWADTLLALTRKKHEHKTLRLLEFIKVRNGPEPKPILLERDENFLHRVTEEDVLCPPEKVREILKALGGKVDGQAHLKAAIMEATGCKERRARDFINLALERQVIRCEQDTQDSRRKVYAA